MDGLIKETNENLKTIINTMKENLNSAIGVLENIQSQMDKKVEEAKKYKIQVDTAKENIRNIEEDNRTLELSLHEINEKYSKMNLVSLIEAGNKEINAKINDNIKEINKNKEQIAELTSKAKTIKDLLINMKKDRTTKEERLENLKVLYEFYSKNINELINYSYENSDNLESFHYSSYNNNNEAFKEDENNNNLDNTMVFDEIADIDENKNFKDEITFINNEIDNNFVNKDYKALIDNVKNKSDEPESLNNFTPFEENEIEEESDIDLNALDSTKVFDSIMVPDYSFEVEEESNDEEKVEDKTSDIDESNEIGISNKTEKSTIDDDIDYSINTKSNIGFEDIINIEPDVEERENIKYQDEKMNPIEEKNIDSENYFTEKNEIEEITSVEKNGTEGENSINDDNIFTLNNVDFDNKLDVNENTQFDLTTKNRINELSELLTDFDNIKNENIETNNIEEKLENTLKNESKDATMLDIFGNPIKSEDIDTKIIQAKKIEELFVENGINFNKFKEDEQNYLKQIYDENKFVGIFNILNKHKINVDNLYHSFNIFGEINFIELDNIINKLVSIGQSVEAIGLILEKMPKIKKYNLDEAIASFNDEIKNVNITELIMRAKELYDGGNK